MSAAILDFAFGVHVRSGKFNDESAVPPHPLCGSSPCREEPFRGWIVAIAAGNDSLFSLIIALEGIQKGRLPFRGAAG